MGHPVSGIGRAEPELLGGRAYTIRAEPGRALSLPAARTKVVTVAGLSRVHLFFAQ